MSLDIDGIFKEIGEFGPYQKRIYFLFCIPVIFVGASNFAQVFITAFPKYRCLVPQCEGNISNPPYYQPFLNFTIPYKAKDEAWDECKRYQRFNSHLSCSPEDYNQNATEECPEGKVFSHEVYLSTIVTEYNLTCGTTWKAEMTGSIYYSGILVGSFIFGIVSDKIGRKLTLMISIISMSVSGVVTGLVTEWSMLQSFQFFNAMTASGLFQTSFVLGLEMVGPARRVLCGIIIEYFFAIGEVLLGLVSWWLREWRMIQLVISTPVSFFVFYWWIIPESPRWLQAQGRHQSCIDVLQKIAQKNSGNISQTLDINSSIEENNVLEDSEIKLSTKVTLLDVLKSPRLCVRILFLNFIWITISLTYYGLSLNAPSFGFSNENYGPFVNFILSALIEIPGYTLSWVSMNRYGRKKSLILSMVVSGILCSVAGFFQEYNNQYMMILTLLGKCFITCAFGIICVFTPEMFPTSVRNTVYGTCSSLSRMGNMAAPFLHQLELVYQPLPLLLFGGLGFMGAAMNLTMPETLGTELPDTVAQALNIGRTEQLRITEVAEDEEHLLKDD